MAMRCVARNCTVTNVYDGCLLSCWLCDCHAHVKCAGFNGRHFDKITAKESGLRWSCWNCREFDVDFYKLFKEAKKGFHSLNYDFLSICSRLKSLEEMFDKFKWPEGKLSSPRRERASSDRQLNVPLTPISDNLGNLFVSPQPLQSLIPSSIIPSSAEVSLANPIVSIPVGRDEGASVSVDVVRPDPAQNRISTVERSLQVDDDDVIGQNSQISHELMDMGDLVVIPPRRTIFISRLSAETSVDKVIYFIKSHLSNFNENDLKVFKFNNSQSRDIASFRVLVPEKIFNTLVSNSFWPQGVLVKEFIPRDRPRRAAPVDLGRPKN